MTNTPSRVWLVTGSSTGFGRSIAKAALAAGDRVMVTARKPEQLDDLVNAHPEHARAATLDITKPEDCESALRATLAAFGRLDVLVNNAGFGLLGALEETSDSELRHNFETNFFGPVNMIRAALPTFRAQRSGHLINMSAAAAISNYAGFSIYGAAKLALEGVSESLAAELAPLGVKVTIVQPGPFRTDFIGRSLQRAGQRIAEYDQTSGKFWTLLSTINGKQPGDPDKAAAAILQVVAADRPPLRLLLGSYAVAKARKKLSALTAEVDQWQSVATSTDFSR